MNYEFQPSTSLHTSYFILHTSYFILHTSYFILHNFSKHRSGIGPSRKREFKHEALVIPAHSGLSERDPERAALPIHRQSPREVEALKREPFGCQKLLLQRPRLTLGKPHPPAEHRSCRRDLEGLRARRLRDRIAHHKTGAIVMFVGEIPRHHTVQVGQPLLYNPVEEG